MRLGAYAVAAALVLYGLVLGYTAYQTHRHLRDAQAAVGLLRTGLVRQDTPARDLDGHLRRLQSDADAARDLTGGPVWGLPAALPWAGRPFQTVRGASAAVSAVAHDVLPPVRAARDGLVGVDLHRADGGLDLSAVAAAERPLAQAQRSSERVLRDVRALPTTGVGTIDASRADLLAQVGALSTQLRSTHEAVALLPPMLGAEGTRRYFVAFQNNAEARGAGGLPGVYAVLRADRGKVTFEHYGVSGDFSGVRVPLTGLSDGFSSHYQGADPGGFFGNTTVSPHFPDGATLLLRYWQAKTGERLDGALAIDPTALSLLLGATGPATLEDGTRVTASSIVSLVERDAYERFADPAERKRYLITVAKGVAGDVLDRAPAQASRLAGAVGSAVAQRRLLVYSTRPEEQRVLAAHPVGGTLSDTAGLFSGVVVNNGGGNKLDYYLDREVTYQAAPCTAGDGTGDGTGDGAGSAAGGAAGGRAGAGTATVTIRLTNRAPRSGLTDYVAGRADRPQVAVPSGTNRLLVGYYATKGAAFSGATLDGKPELLAVDSERGRPVFTSTLEIGPGQTRTLRMTIEEPAGAVGPVTTLVQPLVLPQKTVVRAPACPPSDG